MADKYLTLSLPPGVATGGTDYNTKNLWNSSQLVRYYGGTHQPIGGWVRMTDSTGVNISHLAGIPRAALAWRPNPATSIDDGPPFIAVGTNNRLYVVLGQSLFDISPLNPIPATNVAPWPTPTIAVTGNLKTSGATTVGTTTTTLVGTTLTGTFNAGDTLIFGATDAITSNTDIVTVTSPVVAAANSATLSFTPAVTQTWGNGTNVVYIQGAARSSGSAAFPPAGSFGFSTFGSGFFGGTGGAGTATFTWATTWSLDTLGSFLVAMSTVDGILYVWQNTGGTPAAQPVWGPVTTGAIVTSGATPANSPTIAITATTLTGTVLQGQTFTISGVQYTALASATAAANIVTVSVAPLAPAAGIPGGTAVSGTGTQAPTGRCTWVTPEGYLMVGGANGIARNIAWADRRSFTQWGATAYNTAGSYQIPTAGKIMAGKRTRNQTLIWTDTDVWAATWIGAPLVYRFDQVGDHCGVISPNAMTVSGTSAMWMGQNCFWMYDGYTRQLPCPCKDFVFNNINQTQVAKIWSMALPEFGEVWWFYPSIGGGGEVDSYVMYEHHESEAAGMPIWYTGTLGRTAGTAEQALGSAQYPILVAPTGEIYNHENGSMRTGEATPFLQSGPIELGEGDTVYSIKQIIADEKTLGDTQFQMTYALYPGLPSGSGNMGQNPQNITIPRFTTAPTDVRILARQVEVKFLENQAVQWRIGKPRLKVAAGGPR